MDNDSLTCTCSGLKDAGHWKRRKNHTSKDLTKQGFSVCSTLAAVHETADVVKGFAGRLMANGTLFRRIYEYTVRSNVVVVFDGGGFTISRIQSEPKLGRRDTRALAGFQYSSFCSNAFRFPNWLF